MLYTMSQRRGTQWRNAIFLVQSQRYFYRYTRCSVAAEAWMLIIVRYNFAQKRACLSHLHISKHSHWAPGTVTYVRAACGATRIVSIPNALVVNQSVYNSARLCAFLCHLCGGEKSHWASATVTHVDTTCDATSLFPGFHWIWIGVAMTTNVLLHGWLSSTVVPTHRMSSYFIYVMVWWWNFVLLLDPLIAD
jgi:hypothetical protein